MKIAAKSEKAMPMTTAPEVTTKVPQSSGQARRW
jgi:hypothetical protein